MKLVQELEQLINIKRRRIFVLNIQKHSLMSTVFFSLENLYKYHCYMETLKIMKLRPEGGGGKHHFFSFHICDRAAEDKQVEKNGSKSDCAFLRYCMSKSEVYL